MNKPISYCQLQKHTDKYPTNWMDYISGIYRQIHGTEINGKERPQILETQIWKKARRDINNSLGGRKGEGKWYDYITT